MTREEICFLFLILAFGRNMNMLNRGCVPQATSGFSAMVTIIGATLCESPRPTVDRTKQGSYVEGN